MVGRFNFKVNFLSKTWRCQVLVGKFNFKPKFGSSKSWVMQSTESPAKNVKSQKGMPFSGLIRFAAGPKCFLFFAP